MSSQPDQPQDSNSLTCPRCHYSFPTEPIPATPASENASDPRPGGTAFLDRPPGLLPQQPTDATPSDLGTPSMPPTCGEATSPLPGLAAGELPAKIGRFAPRALLGEGTFGLVYRAYDPALKREVALKVAKPEQLHSRQRIARFQREAQAAAHLMHAHIVPVFDSGQDGPHHYIASAFIQGQSLAHTLGTLAPGQTLPLQQAVEIVRKLAEALAYAHREQVIHRDIKPANVMLRHDGEPLLMDFGLAARAEGEEKLTQAGMVLGTPEYMAPEQWQGQAKPASDQYSLGCLLFELLTGRLPFTGGTPEQYLFLHTQRPAPSPRKFNGSVPRDLETVCLKCLEKEAGQRYADCGALAEDLARWQRGEPVTARRVGWAERCWRWSQRNPLAAGLAAAFLGTLLLGAGVATGLALWALAEAGNAKRAEEQSQKEAGQARQDRDRAEDEKKKKEEELRRAEWEAYRNQITLAHTEWQHGSAALAWEYLERCPWHLRGWEHDYLATLFNKIPTFQGHTGFVYSVATSPDGKRIVSGSADSTVKVWDAATGQETLSLRGHTAPVLSVAFSPDGQRIVSASQDSMVKVWDADKGQQTLSLMGHTGFVTSVAYSPDGQRIVSASQDSMVKVWDADKGQETLSLMGHGSPVSSVAFSPDGKRIVTGSDRTVKVWDAATGQETLSFRGHTGPVSSVAFSPDGKRIVSGSFAETAKVWDADKGQQTLSLMGHKGIVYAVAFSPDGQRIVSGGEDRTVKVWDAATGQQTLSLKGHTGTVKSVAFTPDGKCIVSASNDRTVKVWDANKNQETLSLQGHGRPVSSVAFSPDGQRIVTGSNDGWMKVWDADKGTETLSRRGHTAWVSAVAFSPDGQRIVSGSYDQTVKVWNADTGQQTLSLKGHSGQVYSVAISPDGQRIVSASGGLNGQGRPFSGEVRVWDATTGQQTLSLQGHAASVQCVAFSPDGQRIVSGSEDRTVKVWDAATGQQTLSLQGHAAGVQCVAFSPDGQRLVSGSNDRTLKVWDADTGRQILSLLGHTGEVWSVAFSPNGKRIVSASRDGRMKVWDAATGQETLSLRGDPGTVRSVAFSPDGKRIVSAGWARTVQLWDADKGTAVLSLRGHPGTVKSVSFSPDGNRVVGKDASGAIRVWDLRSGQLLPEATDTIQDSVPQAISPDGRLQAVANGMTIQVIDQQVVLESQRRRQASFKQLARFDPDWHRAQASLGEQEGQHFAATFHLGRLLRAYPWDADLHVRRAHALARQAQATESSLHLVQALLLHPRVSLWPLNPQAGLRAEAAAQTGDWPHAVLAFHSAVHQPGAPPSLFCDLLLAQAAAGQASACRQSLGDIVRLLPEVKELAVVNNLLFVCQAFPWDETLLPRLEERIRRDLAAQRNAVTLHRHGVALYRSGRPEQALTVLEESIRAHGKGGFVDTWLFQAMTYRQLGRLDQAKQQLARFEAWHQKQKFATWQQRIFWETLLREAQTVVNGPRLMPKVTDPD